jgi:hypothetical protein
MRRSRWSPSIVPSDDQNVVVGDFVKRRRVCREADVDRTDLATVRANLLADTTGRWAQDGQDEIACEHPRRADKVNGPLTSLFRRFVAFSLALTACVCIGTYLAIHYFSSVV